MTGGVGIPLACTVEAETITAGVGVAAVIAAVAVLAVLRLSGVRASLGSLNGAESPREIMTPSCPGSTSMMETAAPAFSVMEPMVLPSMTSGIWVSEASVPDVVAEEGCMIECTANINRKKAFLMRFDRFIWSKETRNKLRDIC